MRLVTIDNRQLLLFLQESLLDNAPNLYLIRLEIDDVDRTNDSYNEREHLCPMELMLDLSMSVRPSGLFHSRSSSIFPNFQVRRFSFGAFFPPSLASPPWLPAAIYHDIYYIHTIH